MSGDKIAETPESIAAQFVGRDCDVAEVAARIRAYGDARCRGALALANEQNERNKERIKKAEFHLSYWHGCDDFEVHDEQEARCFTTTGEIKIVK